MKTPRLRSDLYALIGVRDGRNRHVVYEIEKKEDIEMLCGARGDWMIVFEEPDQEWLDTMLKPFMLAASTNEILRAQKTGEQPSTHPVIYYAPRLKTLYPHTPLYIQAAQPPIPFQSS